jgi:hypothetical protein
MQIRIDNIEDHIVLDDSNYLNSGGEGEIYTLPLQMLVKLYHDDQLTLHRQEKVLKLCSWYETYRGLFNQKQYAFPQQPANRVNPGEADDDEIVGFAMANLGAHLPRLDSIGFKEIDFERMVDGRNLTDDAAIALIYDLYESLHKLHTAHFILGDLNPSNILYDFDTRKPCFIDVDSAAFGKYGCMAYTEPYLDPLIEETGKNAEGSFKFNPLSDCYAMAVIAYELFVGAHPFAFRTIPPMRESERRQKRMALMGHLEDTDFLSRMGSNFLDHPQNTIRLDRLSVLKRKDLMLYQYLFDTLLRDRRENLLSRLPKTDKRNPAYIFHAKGKVETIADVLQKGVQQPYQTGAGRPIDKPKTTMFDDSVNVSIWDVLRRHQHRFRQEVTTSDPDMFKLFVANMGIDYQQIVQQGVQPHA